MALIEVFAPGVERQSEMDIEFAEHECPIHRAEIDKLAGLDIYAVLFRQPALEHDLYRQRRRSLEEADPDGILTPSSSAREPTQHDRNDQRCSHHVTLIRTNRPPCNRAPDEAVHPPPG